MSNVVSCEGGNEMSGVAWSCCRWQIISCEPCKCKDTASVGSAYIVCRAGSMQLLSVRLSVCPSGRRVLLQVCCCGPGSQEISINSCIANGPAATNVGSAALSADVGS